MMIWCKKEVRSVTEALPAATLTIEGPDEAHVHRETCSRQRPRGASPSGLSLQDLPRLLLAHEMITPEDLETAQVIQSRTGGFIGDILLDEQILEENSLVAFIARQYKIPFLCLSGYDFDERLFSLIPRDVCLQYRIVPIDKLGKNLTLAMVNPFDEKALEVIHESCPNLVIRPLMCSRRHFKVIALRIIERRRHASHICTARRRSTDDDQQIQNCAAHPCAPYPEPMDEPLSTTDTDVPADISSPEPILSVDDSISAQPPETQDAEPQDDPVSTHSGDDEADDTLVQPQPAASPWPCRRQLETGRTAPSEAGEVTTAMVSAMKVTFDVLLKRLAIFHGLAPESVAQVFARARVVEYQAGSLVWQQDDERRCIFAVLSGAVEICGPSGLLDRALPGETFGETALVSTATMNSSARATEPSCLLQLTLEDITRDLPAETAVGIMLNITASMGRRLNAAYGR